MPKIANFKFVLLLKFLVKHIKYFIHLLVDYKNIIQILSFYKVGFCTLIHFFKYIYIFKKKGIGF